jgi:hypothetical protein
MRKVQNFESAFADAEKLIEKKTVQKFFSAISLMVTSVFFNLCFLLRDKQERGELLLILSSMIKNHAPEEVYQILRDSKDAREVVESICGEEAMYRQRVLCLLEQVMKFTKLGEKFGQELQCALEEYVKEQTWQELAAQVREVFDEAESVDEAREIVKQDVKDFSMEICKAFDVSFAISHPAEF